MMPLWALLGSAAASVLYVNGVRADGLRDFAFEEVDVPTLCLRLKNNIYIQRIYMLSIGT